jgi:hypothetical protein
VYVDEDDRTIWTCKQAITALGFRYIDTIREREKPNPATQAIGGSGRFGDT